MEDTLSFLTAEIIKYQQDPPFIYLLKGGTSIALLGSWRGTEMKRVLHSIMIFGLLSATELLSFAQCQKRVVTYLDTSGSMFQGMNPYNASLELLQNIRKDVPGSELVFDGYKFGGLVDPGKEGVDKDHLAELMSYFQPSRPPMTTDLIAVIDNIARTVPQKNYSGQVIIIASDFAHDPNGSRDRNGSEARADWIKRYSQSSSNIQTLFGPNSNTVLVLLKAPISSNNLKDRQSQNLVLGSLGPIAKYQADLAMTDPHVLSQVIQKYLTQAPTATARLVGSRVKISVKNNDCNRILISSLKVNCLLGGGVKDEQIIKVAADTSLGKAEQHWFESDESVSENSCWTDSQANLRASCGLSNGPECVEAAGAGGTNLQITSASVRLTKPPIPFMRPYFTIKMDLTGTFAGKQSFPVKLRSMKGSRDILTGSINAPEDLAEHPKRYLLLVDSKSADSVELQGQNDILLTAARDSEKSVRFENDDFFPLFAAFGPSVLSVLASIVGLLVWFFKREKSSFLAGLNNFLGKLSGCTLVIAAILMIANRWIAAHFSFGFISGIKMLELLSASLIVTVIIVYGIHVQWINRLHHSVENEGVHNVGDFTNRIWSMRKSMFWLMIVFVLILAIGLYDVIRDWGFAHLLEFTPD